MYTEDPSTVTVMNTTDNVTANYSAAGDGNCTFDYTGTTSSTNYMYAIAIPINILNMMGNGLILDVHRRVPKARSAVYYPIILLAAGDICAGIAGPITLVLYYVRKSIGDMHYIQIANYSMFIFAFTSALLALSTLTYDRLIGTFWPLQHRTAMTRRRYLVMNTFVFVPSITIGIVIPFTWHNKFDPNICYVDWDILALLKVEYVRYITGPLTIIVFSCIIGMYLIIFCKVKQHLKNRQRIIATPSYYNASTRTGLNAGEDKNVERAAKSEKRLLVTSLLILGSFSICWLPFICTVLVQVYGPDEFRTNLTLISLRSLMIVPALLNSTINPVIYGLRIPVFKQGARRILCCCCKTDLPMKQLRSVTGTVSGGAQVNNNTGHADEAGLEPDTNM